MPPQLHEQQRAATRPGGPAGGPGRAGGGGGGGGAGGGPEPRLRELLKPPAEKVQYFTALAAGRKGGAPVLRAELVDEDARKAAETMRELAASQLRRFYGAVMALKRRIDLDKDLPDSEILAQMALLKAKAAYTWGRRTRGANEDFVQFFVRHTHAVDGRAAFLAFARHFEAVMAFHKYFERLEKDERP